MIPIDAYVNITEKNDILICLCIKKNCYKKQQVPENSNIHAHYVNQFAFIW